MYQHIVHPFPPICDNRSKILILGTLPSVKSRETDFYYGHKQNRFWKVLAAVCKSSVPKSVEEKKALLLQNYIALWDVVLSCDIKGSSDSSIKNVVPTDLQRILSNSEVIQIYANGVKAGQLYKKYQEQDIGREITVLPSTSPANAVWTLERLIESWSVIERYIP